MKWPAQIDENRDAHGTFDLMLRPGPSLGDATSSAELQTPVFLSVVIPVYNAAGYLASCLENLRLSVFSSYECIVVDDGSTDGSAEIARAFGATVIGVGRNRGPAHARNLGTRVASGEVILFLDADVCIDPDAMSRIRRAFTDDPSLDAVIGSYDDAPRSPDFLSCYRNLLHCYVHRNGRRRASTFWSGCGAVRRKVLMEAGGFDESYQRPSIEDIELGYRLTRSGKSVALDPAITVKHLKHWSLAGLIRTDIRDRGIPWTELILRDRRMPDDLNLRISQRISAALAAALVPAAALAVRSAGRGFALSVCALVYLCIAPLAVRAMRNRERVLAVAGLWSVASLFAFWTGAPWLILPLFGVMPVLYLRDKIGHYPATTWTYTAYLVILPLAIGIRFGNPALYAFYSILGLLIALNLNFYRFLAARMGNLQALAAIPFHVFFHLYSGVSFGAGIFKYFLLPRHGKDNSVNPSPLGIRGTAPEIRDGISGSRW